MVGINQRRNFENIEFNLDLSIVDGRRVPNIEKLRKHLLREGQIEKEELLGLINEANKIFSK